MELTPRQAEFADAGLAICAREGLAAVSFRTVAAEAGWSLGAVQKAFSTKDDLVSAMFARLRQAESPMPPGEPGRPSLRGWLTELMMGLLPLDEGRRTVQLQASAFSDRAAFDPGIGRAIAASDAEIRGLLASLVRRAQAEGEAPHDLDPDQVAWGWLVAATGVTSQLLYDPQPADAVRPRVDSMVAALLKS